MFKIFKLRKDTFIIDLLAVLMLLLVFFILNPETAAAIEEEKSPFINSNYIMVDDILFHYRIWPSDTGDSVSHSADPQKCADKTGERILLIHGLGGSTYSWRYLAPELAEAGYKVVAVDLPGFGYSSRQTGLDHSQKQRAEWLWKLVDKLERAEFRGQKERDQDENYRPGSWHLVGHSMGGGTAAAMAARHPDFTNSLLLIAPALERGGTGFGISDFLDYDLVKRGGELLLENIFFTRPLVGRALKSAYGKEPTAEEVSAHLKPLQRPGTAEVWLDIIATASGVTIEEIENLDIPVLLIWGEEDSWVNPEQGLSLKDDLFDAHMFLIPDSGHNPMETHYHQVNREILAWLKSENLDPGGNFSASY